jgi:hypothetical protein
MRNEKTEKINMHVDHTLLNQCVLRFTHPTRTPCDAVVEVDSECRFSISFDAVNGYFIHTPLSVKSPFADVSDSLRSLIVPPIIHGSMLCRGLSTIDERMSHLQHFLTP